MKLKRLSEKDDEGVAMLIRVVQLEDTSEEDEPWDEGTIPTGTYATDSKGRVWKLDDTVTMLFQGLGAKK